jgi:hypothetical protein
MRLNVRDQASTFLRRPPTVPISIPQTNLCHTKTSFEKPFSGKYPPAIGLLCHQRRISCTHLHLYCVAIITGDEEKTRATNSCSFRLLTLCWSRLSPLKARTPRQRLLCNIGIVVEDSTTTRGDDDDDDDNMMMMVLSLIVVVVLVIPTFSLRCCRRPMPPPH